MDQEIEIPSHFVCPVSLQLMKDPVIVSTGITYDRDNIEEWLFSRKNDTCPVTKQILSDSDLTPNHTLRRLIQSWCILNASYGIERIPTPKRPVDRIQIEKLLRDATDSSTESGIQLKCLKRLRSIALEGERNRSCLESAGAIDFVLSIIKQHCGPTDVMRDEIMHQKASQQHFRPLQSENVNQAEEAEFRSLQFENTSQSTENTNNVVEEAISILYQLKISGSCLKNIINKNDFSFVESLISVLKHGSFQSRSYATMLLKNVYEVSDPIRLMSVSPEFFAQIVRVLRDQISHQASKSALKLLVELCPWGRNRIKAVEGGAVTVLIELLLESKYSDKRSCELNLMLLDQLCGCAEGRAELLGHGAGVAVVSKKILRVSHVASDRAVRILSSICKFSGNPKVVVEMLQVGVVTKLCLVLQVDSSKKTKERAREILRMHSKVWRNSSCIPSHLLASFPSSP